MQFFITKDFCHMGKDCEEPSPFPTTCDLKVREFNDCFSHRDIREERMHTGKSSRFPAQIQGDHSLLLYRKPEARGKAKLVAGVLLQI